MLKKIENTIKNNKEYVITFLISIFIVGFIYSLNNVSPFGNKSLLCVDFFHQYGPMLGGLYEKLTHFENIIYSFNVGLGIPFFRNFFNYLSSPFNIIIFLFDKKHLLTSFSFIIGLKATFASVFMLYFLNKKFNYSKWVFIPLALSYGFSQYFIAYYWNIMWLDGLVFLPLIVLGIENIINDNKWKLYFISLSIMLFSNYFIGYMICIYSVIYFICYLIYKTEFSIKDIKSSLKFILKKSFMFFSISLLSGSILAVFLLPMFSSMFSISATGGSIPLTQYYLFDIKDFLISHLSGTTVTVFASDTVTSPNISCGILSVVLLILFYINPKIKLKTKITYSFILGFIIFAFFNPILDYIMHALHVPNDLPYRYSFLYSFTLVIMCAYSLKNIREIIFQLVTIVYLLLISIILYLTINHLSEVINTNMLFINIILLTLFYIMYILYKYFDKAKIYSLVGTTLFTLVSIIISTNYNWNISQEIHNFYTRYDEINNNLKYIRNTDKEKFYRVEATEILTLNDGDWYDYNGVNTFSSMAYESVAQFQNKLGIPGNEINSYYYQQTTPIYDLLFDVKYLLGKSNDYTRYKTINEEENNLQMFNYTNGLIFGVKDDINNLDLSSNNPFELQNNLMKSFTGVENILTESNFIKTEELYDGDEGTILKYSYKNNYDNMYFYTKSSFIDFIIIGETLYYINENYSDLSDKVSNLNYSYVDDYNESRIINISSVEKNLNIIIGYNHYYSDEFYLYDINQSLFESAYNYLSNYKFDITKFKNNNIEGNITLDDNMMIYTSIPYDKGWKIYVDNKLVEAQSLENAFLIFKASKGTHKIKLVYYPPYIGTGFIITLLSLIILIFNKKVINLFKS